MSKQSARLAFCAGPVPLLSTALCSSSPDIHPPCPLSPLPFLRYGFEFLGLFRFVVPRTRTPLPSAPTSNLLLFQLTLRPIVVFFGSQFLGNITSALSTLPPALFLPDLTAAGDPVASSDNPFAPSAARVNPHSLFLDTTILALERLPASPTTTGYSTADTKLTKLPGVFVCDVRLTLNDTRVVNTAGGPEEGTASLTQHARL